MAKSSKPNRFISTFVPRKDIKVRQAPQYMGILATTVLCVVFLLSPTVSAVDPFATGPYPTGWYDALAVWEDVPNIHSLGGNTTLALWGYSSEYSRDRYLDEAAAGGMRVIMGFDDAFINAYSPVDVAGILDYVNTYKDHPAVAGWYTADEPWYGPRTPLSTMQLAYDTIKSVDDKPVFITFTEYALNPVEAGGNIIAVDWKNAYDQFLLDVYPTRTGEPEFSRLENEGRGKDFKNDMIRAQQASIAADRPWWAILSGWGNNTDAGETGGYRLPTYNESRFATYWALSENPVGILHFAFYRTGRGQASAQPGEPYPYDGGQWLEDVWEPQTVELNTLGPAVLNGKIAGAVSDDATDIRADVYYDPGTGKYYVVTLNSTTGSETPTFTVTMADPPGEKIISATPLFEGAEPEIPIIGDQFSDAFSQYEVHVYELTTMLLGDANGSDSVSADDYGSVQANFGDTGVPGLPGDANGTGAVSADDYGSVQLYFGATRAMGGAPVPEPATLALLGAGGLMLIRRRKRMRKVLISLMVLSLIPALAGAGASNPEGFEGYALTTVWDPTVIGEGWIRYGEDDPLIPGRDPEPASTNTVNIAVGSEPANTTQVLKLDSTGNGENLSAIWYQSVADADAGPVTTTTFQFMPIIGHGNTEYRMSISRGTGYPGAYSWEVLIGLGVTNWWEHEPLHLSTYDYNEVAYPGPGFVAYHREDIPGGDFEVTSSAADNIWYTLEIEEDNGAYDYAAWVADSVNNHGSSSRARLKIADGEWNAWTGWLLHEDEDNGLSYTKYASSFSNGRISTFTNGRTEYDNFSMVWGSPVPEPATLSLLCIGGAAMLRRKKRG